MLPPKAKWYLLGKNRDDTENESSFDTFFDLRKVRMSIFHTMLTLNYYTICAYPLIDRGQLGDDQHGGVPV